MCLQVLGIKRYTSLREGEHYLITCGNKNGDAIEGYSGRNPGSVAAGQLWDGIPTHHNQVLLSVKWLFLRALMEELGTTCKEVTRKLHFYSHWLELYIVSNPEPIRNLSKGID